MNQKEIKELIKSDENRLSEVIEGYKNIPEYKEIQKELDDLFKKKSELENKMYSIKVINCNQGLYLVWS